MLSTPTFDIIICGGGHVGSSLALALAQLELRVAVIDDAVDKNYGNRVFALSTASQKFLAMVHVWPALHTQSTPIEQLHLSNKGSFGAARLCAKDFQQDYFGYTVPAVALQHALSDALKNTNVTVFSPAHLESFHIHANGVEVMIKTPETTQTLHAHWLIGADGAHSRVRQHAGIGTRTTAYQQKALVALVDLAQSHHFTAYERLVDNNALTVLPHTPWQAVVIWIADNATIDALLLLDEKKFIKNKLF